MRAGEPVSTERLIDALWGEHPPKSAANSVHVYVSQLRKALGDGRLQTQGNGYVLRLEPEELDAARFERLVAEARGLRARGDARAALDAFSRALALWRGPPLADLPDNEALRVDVARLEDARLAAIEERAEAGLELGNAPGRVAELEALVRADPFRERPRALLMLALYRSGRQAEALEVYREGRRLLSDELGLEPGPELRALEQAILAQDPALDGPRRAIARPSRRGGLLLLAGALVLLAATAAVVVELTRGGGGLAGVAPNSLGVLDLADNRLAAQVPTGVGPGALTVADGSVWVANGVDGTVSRIDAATRSLRRTISLEGTPVGVAADRRGVWVLTTQGALYLIDPRYDTVRRLAMLSEPGSIFRDTLAGLATGLGAIWTADRLGLVRRHDARGRVTATIDAGFGASAMAVGAGAVWVANTFDGTVSRIDPAGSTTRIPVGHGPAGIAVGAGAVWVTDSLDDTLVRIDPETTGVVATIPVGRDPTAVAVARGSVWVAARQAGRLFRVEAGSNRVAGSVSLGSSPAGLAVDDRSLWISAGQQAPAAGSDSGVLRVEAAIDPGPLDPAFPMTAGGLQLAYLTCAKLMNYLDRPAPDGSRVVPEVAQSAPLRSADGRQYTFIVRPGFRFAPPSNEPVTAATFKQSIERALDPRLAESGAPDMSDVVGVDAYRAGRADGVAGIAARGNTLAFTLRRPLGDLPERLSAASFCAVPRGAPVGPGPRVLPAAGPYYVSSYTPGQKLVLLRNPHYGGSRPRRPREIKVTLDVDQDRELADVEAGRADYAAGGVPARADRALRKRYLGRRYFVNPVLGLRMLVLNTSRPPFSQPSLRRAVAYAVDRSALAAQERRFFSYGTLGGGDATDAYLPAGIAGAAKPGAYPLAAPDRAKARALLAGTRRRAVLYTCNVPPCTQEAELVRSELSAVGIDVDVREFAKPVMFARANEPQAGYDILTIGWFADYADPGDFLDPLLGGGSESAGWGTNWAHFRDAVFTPRLRAAARLSGPARYRAYAALARGLADRSSPLVVYESDESRDFFSARVGCQVYQPVYGMDLATLCLKS